MRARNWPGTGSGRTRRLCGERRLDKILAPQIPVYAYEFDDQTAPFYFPKMPGFLSLAYHTADIQYLFPLWHGGPLPASTHPLNKKQTDLSDQLVAAWTNFAWTGNPNGLGNYPWPRYTQQHDQAGLADPGHAGPVDVDGPAVLRDSQLRLLGLGHRNPVTRERFRRAEARAGRRGGGRHGRHLLRTS